MADSVSLLESRGRRPVATAATTTKKTSIAVPHVSPKISRNNTTGGAKLELFEMPGLKSLVRGSGRRSSTTETPAAPLVRRDASCGNIVRATASLASLRKCEPVSGKKFELNLFYNVVEKVKVALFIELFHYLSYSKFICACIQLFLYK